MDYTGKMYGKIGNKYFELPKTALDFDNLVTEIEQLKADKEDVLGLLEAYIFELDNGQFEFFNKYGFNISELSNKFRQTLEKHGK